MFFPGVRRHGGDIICLFVAFQAAVLEHTVSNDVGAMDACVFWRFDFWRLSNDGNETERI